MGRTACTEPQCLYKGAFYLLPFYLVQDVPLATEPGISLIILTPMKILQRNLNRSTFVVWEIKRNVSVACLFRCNIFIRVRIIKEMPGSLASGTPCTFYLIKPSSLQFKLRSECIVFHALNWGKIYSSIIEFLQSNFTQLLYTFTT